MPYFRIVLPILSNMIPPFLCAECIIYTDLPVTIPSSSSPFEHFVVIDIPIKNNYNGVP